MSDNAASAVTMNNNAFSSSSSLLPPSLGPRRMSIDDRKLISVESVSIPTTTTVTTISSKNDDSITASSSTPRLSVSHVQIGLDPDEQRLFDVIVEACAAFGRGDFVVPNMQEKCCNLTVRVAGGWVRDKLLGLETHDIDLAVDLVTGTELATLLRSYIQQQQHAAQEQQQQSSAKDISSSQDEHDETKQPTEKKKKNKHSDPNSVCGKIGVIAANPAQSKHLETATMRIYGMDVDMANLRAQEIYTTASRIPVVRMGTPLEDAERRDFTVNALFYNLQTRQVEDWTGRGLHDLVANRLVTPLEPVQTFRDDPLRVLRAIRFAVRYQFQLDTALEDACQLPEIHKALHIKVSRERVGKELEGMLTGKGANPICALELISRLQLAGSVFCLPKVEVDGTTGNGITAVKGHLLGEDYTGLDFDSDRARLLRKHAWQESDTLLKLLPKILQSHDAAVQQRPTASRHDGRLLPVGVFLLPFRTLKFEETKRGIVRTCSVAPYIFREGIKFKNKDVQAITVLEDTVNRFMDFMSLVAADMEVDPTTAFCRLDTGLLLRATKDLWPDCLIMATVLLVRKQQQQEEKDNAKSSSATTDWLNVANQIYNTICDLSLDECWKMKPLLDGGAVIQALGLPRGPVVGTFLEEQVKWMLLNPKGSREECEAHLRSVKRQHDECMVESDSTNNLLGMSDGINATRTGGGDGNDSNSANAQGRHFSKKMHVESMELT